MSFASDVKTELAKVMPGKPHCAEAELLSVFAYGQVSIFETSKGLKLRFFSENILIAKKVFTILKKSFNIKTGVFVQSQKHKILYGIEIEHDMMVRDVMQRLGLVFDALGNLRCRKTISFKKPCCEYSFLRGVFLLKGSINDPANSYHMEISVDNEKDADILADMFKNITPDIKISRRKDSYVVYLKESQAISDTLAALGASIAMLNFENAKIVNETRGMINRRVNCEVSNLRRSVNAGNKQIECIKLIEEKMGLDGLSDGLKQIAELRLKYPEVSLQELGELADPPLGKSGVNHRLQKLISIAEGLKSRRRMKDDNSECYT